MLSRSAVLLVFASCVESSSVRCPDGTTCPERTACATIDDRTLCVLPDQIASCDGKPELDACGPSLRCYDGVCLAAGCGNGRVDPGERCDDENTAPNDGCSADCLSDETCGNGVVDFVKREECDDGPVAHPLSHDGCASDCTLEVAAWNTVPPLAQLADSAFAYDAKRDRLVLFGDQDGARTWEWDGARWQLRVPRLSPVPRSNHAMAYDPVNEVVVMFGGNSANDTWEWDGTTWSLRSPATSPPGRSDHMMVTDPRRKRIVMFGGENAARAPLGDTWAWDGTNWTQLQSIEAPSPRRNAGLAYDPARDVVVLFGGLLDSATFDDQTWELVGSAWTRRTPASVPPARAGLGMAWDPRSRQILMHGGSGGGSRTDSWLWNGSDWTQHPIPGPALTVSHLQTTVQREGYVVAHDRGKTFRWNAGWSQLEDATPTILPRFAASGAVDLAGRRVLIHGGVENSTSTASSMIWTGTWQRLGNTVVGSSPGRVQSAAMTYDVVRRQFVHFGGFSATTDTAVNDTWVYDEAWLKKSPGTPLPAPRFGHVLVYDAARDRSVLFGGTGFDDTWLWDGAQWALAQPVMKPSARESAAAAYDPIRKVVVLFGGLDIVPLADTWEWDGTTWTPRLVAGPPARFSAGMAWDTARKRMVLYGGAGQDNSLNDQWEWDGQAWKQLPTLNSVKARASHVMVSAMSNGGVLSFGGAGASATTFSDLLWLHWDNDAVEELCHATDADGDALVGCADGDCWRVCKPDCAPGTSCMSTRGCGDGTCDPITESCSTCSTDCSCAVWCGNLACETSESAATCPGDCP